MKRKSTSVGTFAALLAALVVGIFCSDLAADSPRPEAPAERGILAALVGEFDLTSTFWPTPDGPPQVSHLPARRSLALDGRVLEIDVGPSARGFTGTGLLGWDGLEERFWYTWVDTSSSGVAHLHGERRADGSGRFEGQTPTPGGYFPLRVEIRREGGVEIHDYFGPSADGREYRWLELRYSRVGG